VEFTISYTRGRIIKANLIMHFRRPMTLVMYLLLLMLIGYNICLMLAYDNAPFVMDVPLVLLFVYPGLNIVRSLSIYKMTPQFRRPVHFSLTEMSFTISGEQFKSELSTESLYKVVRAAGWLFIYHNRQNANPIPPEIVKTLDLQRLKALLTEKGVKNNL
jgi:hypothetical protein